MASEATAAALEIEVLSAEEIPQDETLGKRRWGRGRWRDDMTYYTFDEYVAFVVEQGLGKDDPHAFALDLWKRSSHNDQEKERKCMEQLVDEVRSLPMLAFEDLSKGVDGVLLELLSDANDMLKGIAGAALRASRAGGADCWGGVLLQSALAVEVVKTSPTLQVRLRSFYGAPLLLRASGELVFAGNAEDAAADSGDVDIDPWDDAGLATATFEVLRRDEEGKHVVSIAAKCGQVIGTFVPRLAPEALAKQVVGCVEVAEDICEALREKARDAAKIEAFLRGFRRHLQDPSMQYYSFEDWVIYVQKRFKPTQVGTLELARAMWAHACVADVEDEPWSVVHGAEATEL